MYKLDLNTIRMLLIYHDVFDEDLPDLKLELSNMNLNKTISIICELIAMIDNPIDLNIFGKMQKIDFQTCLKVMTKLNYDVKDYDDFMNPNNFIISLQTLLILLKCAISYCDQKSINDEEYTITTEDYLQIVRLNLVIAEQHNDLLDNFDEDYFIYANLHINKDADVRNEIIRSYYILNEIGRDENCFELDVQKEYKNYYDDFENRYNYSPIDFMCVVYWELREYYHGFEKRRLQNSSIWKKLNTLYKSGLNRDIGKLVISDLAKDIKFYRTWSITTKKQFEFDFSLFFQQPFISDGNGGYISISELTLKNCFFEKLYWMIRDCYSKNDVGCMAFYGRLFEKYVQNLTDNALENNDVLSYIPEFSYKGYKSSDTYIKKGLFLLAIEVKGYSILQDSLIKNTKVESNIDKLFIKPILQADKCFDFLDANNCFGQIDEVFVISVTMDGLSSVPNYLNKAKEKILKDKKSKKVKYIFNFSIEEYEVLMRLAEQKKDIFLQLKDYYQLDRIKPFKDYVKDKMGDVFILPTKFMDEVYQKWNCDLKKYYGMK